MDDFKIISDFELNNTGNNCKGGCEGCMLYNPEACVNYKISTPDNHIVAPYDPEFDIDLTF
jgi:hypothetical protein